tara:strand:- start:677 stop:1348 length:672 start_codon:yes stop_codon:yes gene_type:complete
MLRWKSSLKPAAAAPAVPTPDLLHWPLNDAAGTTIAASVGPGSTTSTGTLNGDYLYMDSGDAAFESSSTLTYGTNIVSVSFWFQTDNTSMYGSVFRSEIYSNTNMFQFYNGGGWKTLRVKGDSGYLEERVYDLLSANTWYHFVCVFDGSTASGDAKFYINKVSQTLSNNSNTKTGTSNFATAEFCMKGPYATTGDFLMDDLRIYSGELTTSQIDAIYDAGRPS